MKHTIHGRCPYCFYPQSGEACTHCRPDSRRPNPADLLPNGYILDQRYIVGHVLHSNSEATLYAAFDRVAGRVLSLREYYPKVLSVRRPDGGLSARPGKEVPFKALRMDFEEVCRYLSRQRADRCIIPCLDVLSWGDTVYGVFTEKEGQTLEDYLLTRGGRLAWTEVKKPFLQLLNTVSAFNREGIIHRGISPVTLHYVDGRLMLAGFGTSAFRTGHSELEAELFYGYAAPEQYTPRGWQGAWTDVYALGAVLYHILSGQRPVDYHGRLTGETLIPPEDFDPTIPHHVSEAILKAMALEVEARFNSADGLYSALLEDADGHTAVFDASGMPPAGGAKKRRGGVLSALGLGAIGLGLTAFLLLRTGWLPGPTPTPDPQPSSESQPASSESVPEPLMTPELVGRDFEALLRDGEFIAYYALSDPAREFSDTVEQGRIISQYPEAGRELAEGQKIHVTISLGPEYTTMPNLIGWRVEEAKRELNVWGIPYHEDLLEIVGEEYTYGIVAKLSIEPGTELSRKTQKVYIYTGRP
jgi:serine/threonine protein kinase